MTDNEIIKALECCIDGYCEDCFYGETDQRHCRDDLMRFVLDLIDRQKAEIERLEHKQNKEYAMVCDVIRQAKAEAIKEFAERLKPKTWRISWDTIDNLVKEMIGE